MSPEASAADKPIKCTHPDEDVCPMCAEQLTPSASGEYEVLSPASCKKQPRPPDGGQEWKVLPNGEKSKSIIYIEPEFKDVSELVASYNASLAAERSYLQNLIADYSALQDEVAAEREKWQAHAAATLRVAIGELQQLREQLAVAEAREACLSGWYDELKTELAAAQLALHGLGYQSAGTAALDAAIREAVEAFAKKEREESEKRHANQLSEARQPLVELLEQAAGLIPQKGSVRLAWHAALAKAGKK